ncbi:MAG: alpha/beta hydrolase [Clostridia bacterium]|nr:alpha/beta hydrolase [Clostridia bacterium]
MREQKTEFQAAGKAASLFISDTPDRPLVLVNEFDGDGSGIAEAMKETGCGDCSLLIVRGIDWEKDMSPWECPAVFPGEPPFSGGADAYLKDLLNEILPEALRFLPSPPSSVCIAGYSLAGLFSLYAMYRTDRFSGCASCSGSMWFPGFAEYAKSHAMQRKPDRLYLSLGDREPRTKNPQMKTVGEKTEELVSYYRCQGIDTTFEWNPGNHFKDPELRIAKGIAALVPDA